jgi:hypothetical protein
MENRAKGNFVGISVHMIVKMPVYNAEAYLEKGVNSILGQNMLLIF